jgi:hypothetical protein
MLKQHVFHHHPLAPLHQLGEVVLASCGNYLEAGNACQPKVRPVILVSVGNCQHRIAGLTTQSHYKITGSARPELTASAAMGLNGRQSYLWSLRASFISRRDLRRHLGWIDCDTVMLLAKHMNLNPLTLSSLWQAVRARTQKEGSLCLDDLLPDAPVAPIVRRPRPR